MKGSMVGILLATLILSMGGSLLFASTIQSQSGNLNAEFEEVVTETLDFLDHAWETAKKFQDGNRDYDSSHSPGNCTMLEPSDLSTLRMTEEGLQP